MSSPARATDSLPLLSFIPQAAPNQIPAATYMLPARPKGLEPDVEKPPIHVVNQRLGLVAGECNQLKLRSRNNLVSQLQFAAWERPLSRLTSPNSGIIY